MSPTPATPLPALGVPAAPPLPEDLETLLRRLRLPHIRAHAPEILATAKAQRSSEIAAHVPAIDPASVMAPTAASCAATTPSSRPVRTWSSTAGSTSCGPPAATSWSASAGRPTTSWP